MAGLLGRVVSLSHGVNEQLLHCLEGGVASPETMDDGGEDLLRRLRSRLTLGGILGAVLQDSLAGHDVLHVHISALGRQLDWVEAVNHPVIPSCEESQLILCDNGCVGLERFVVAEPALLLSMLGE